MTTQPTTKYKGILDHQTNPEILNIYKSSIREPTHKRYEI